MFEINIKSWALPLAVATEKDWTALFRFKVYKLSFLCFHLTIISVTVQPSCCLRQAQATIRSLSLSKAWGD